MLSRTETLLGKTSIKGTNYFHNLNFLYFWVKNQRTKSGHFTYTLFPLLV